MADHRIEHDSLGEVRVPADALWGAQTQRAVENFPISGLGLPAEVVQALALVKAEAARENARRRDVATVDRATGDAIAAAADAIAAGAHADQFPVDVFQTGSGTSSNMNMNEVVARLASDRLGRTVHPNDQVNASQSSNDVFPTAVHVAATRAVVDELVPALEHLVRVLRRKQRELADVVKAGRTHLMDATPVTLGQELGGYAAQVADGIARLRDSIPRLAELPIGGTAVGTGLNAPKGFGRAVASRLAERTGLPFTEARDHFAAQGARDGLVECSAALRTLAGSLLKIANDLRWMNSGPRAGLGEIQLPDLQPGSSIMPGKVNPVIPEAVSQVVARVFGNDLTVAFAGSQGAFELNVFIPVMAHALLESVRLLTNVSRLFADRCIAGIVANTEKLRADAESSPSVATALNLELGYDTVAELVKESIATGASIRELVVGRGLLTSTQLDALLDVDAMARGERRR